MPISENQPTPPDPNNTSVAELIKEGARLAKSYGTLHGKETRLVKDLARVVVRLREKHEDAEGRPDFRGRSKEYRDAVARVYEKAGIPSDASSNLQALVRYHMSTVLREHMVGRGYTAADFQYYGLAEESQNDRHKVRERAKTQAAASAAPELVINRDDLPGTALTVLQRGDKDLRVLTEDAEALSSVVSLTGDARERAVAALDAIEEHVAVVRASMA